MEDLHVRIRRWRKRAGLTQGQLAEKVGVSIPSVSYWESDGEAATKPTADNLERIAAACGVTLPVFFGRLPPAPKRKGSAA